MDRAVRDTGEPKAPVQRAGGFRHIVDIDRLPRHMLMRGVVPLVRRDPALDFRSLQIER